MNHRCRHRRKLSVIGAVMIPPALLQGRSKLRLLLRWHTDKSVRTPQVVCFIKALLQQVRGNLIVVWDGLQAHRAVAVRDLAAASGRMELERLPGYAPELNPVEGVWCNIKWHKMANHGLTEVPAIHAMAKAEGRNLRDDQRLLRSFIRATPLPIRI
jgi:DDE superfamily endonuclease